MAPPSAESTGTVPSFKLRPSQFIRSLGSVAPVMLMILLLLLCFPFKKKKRQLSTRTAQRDLNMSELISMTKLEDGLTLRNSLEDGCLHKGNTLPSHQVERPRNGFSSELQQESSDSPELLHPVNSSQQRMEKLNADHQRRLSPQASGPNILSQSPLQLRKLPVTPKEACISSMDPLILNLDNQVYESIGAEKWELCPKDWLEGGNGSNGPTVNGFCAGPVELGGKDSEVVESNSTQEQLAPILQCQESDGQLQNMTAEKDAPFQLDSDSRRLSAMYARVCKRTKASQQMKSENHNEPMDQEEEEPPPIPIKCFESIYESLSIDSKMQEGH